MNAGRTGEVVVGGEPRVNLLPPEVEQAKRVRAIRRIMLTLVVGAVLVAGTAYGAVAYLDLLAQQRLEEENVRTSELLAQQQEYLVVRTTTERLATAQAAVMVGSSTEIDLAQLLAESGSLLNPGSFIVTAAGDTASPFDAYAQATVPLQPQRIGTFNFVVRTGALTDVRDWLVRLQTMAWFADATPGSVALQPDGTYLAAVTLHIDTEAFAGRFAPADDEAEDDDVGGSGVPTKDADGSTEGSGQ